MVQKSTLPANVSKTPLPGQRLTSSWQQEITFATVKATDDDVSFCNGSGMLIHKTTKLCINSMWIALLIHGFVPVKTWLLTQLFMQYFNNSLWKSLAFTGKGETFIYCQFPMTELHKQKTYEPCHEKTCLCHMRTTKAHISPASAQSEQRLCCSLLG